MSSLDLTVQSDDGESTTDSGCSIETTMTEMENENTASIGYSGRALRTRTNQSTSNDKLRGIIQPLIRRRSQDSTTRILKDSDVKKIYLNNKRLGRVKVTHLETIFEEAAAFECLAKPAITVPTTATVISNNAVPVVTTTAMLSNNSINNNISLIFGARKIKRSLSLSEDAFRNPSKTLKEKRKNRIKKLMGKVKRLQRISKSRFQERLRTMHESDGAFCDVDFNNIENGNEFHRLILERRLTLPTTSFAPQSIEEVD